MIGRAAMMEFDSIFKRDSGCVSCPGTAPNCKTLTCPSGQFCSLSVQTCTSCASTICISTVGVGSTTGGTAQSAGQTVKSNGSSGGSGAPVGAIVGGVIGFLVICIGVAFFVVRRNKQKQKALYEASVAAWAVEKENASYRDPRASTHTVGSIASTVLTRASNVIQIAYIPGVTNLSHPNSPSHLIPPVPPIPGNNISQNSLAPGDHQQFFSAEDILRQSVWSNHSDISLIPDPRASVATTIYRSNAIVSPLAATAVRAKAAVVTVKNSPAPSSGSSSPRTTSADSPPVPALDLSKFPTPRLVNGEMLSPTSAERPPHSPAFSVGSTFLNKMSMASKPDGASTLRVSKVQRANEAASPFSDAASVDNDTVAPLRTFQTTGGRTSPARFLDGDIRMSFRPMSEAGSELGNDSPLSPDGRGKSPFGDEHKVKS